MTINESTVDWLIWTVDPDPEWAAHVGPQPDLVEFGRTTAVAAGFNAESIDEIAVVQWLLGLFAAFSESMLVDLDQPENFAPLETILTRRDLRLEDPWNYLTWLGPTGVAMHRELSRVLVGEDVARMLVRQLRSGQFVRHLRPLR